MKLRIISEINRRDFLAKSGKGALAILLGTGIDPALAKELAGGIVPGSYTALNFLDDSSIYHTDDVSKNAQITWKGLKTFPKMLGLSGSTSMVGMNDAIYAGVGMDQNGLASVLGKMVNDGWEVFPEDDGSFLLSKGSDEIGIERTDNLREPDAWISKIESFGGFLKTWWDGWGANGNEPASAKFIKMLTDHGVDFYDRPKYVYEMMLDGSDLEELERRYGNADELVKRAEAKGVDTSKLRYSEPESIEVPQDYRVASPMHQSFESRLERAFNIV